MLAPAVRTALLTPPWTLRAGGIPATIDLDFKNNRGLLHGRAVDPGAQLTCARAATSRYISPGGTMRSFGSNVLRRLNRGLFVEGPTTNLHIRSQVFNTGWTLGNFLTVTDNAGVAPDGTTTAALLIPDTANAYHAPLQNVVLGSGKYAASIHLKPAGYTKCGIRENLATGQYASFNLVGSGIILDVLGDTPIVEPLADGWYRIQMPTDGQSTTENFGYYIQNDAYTTGSPATAWVGDGVKGMYYWGAQAEAGNIATSYVPTVAASASRPAENVDFADISWLGSSHTFLTKATTTVTTSSGGNADAHVMAAVTNNTNWVDIRACAAAGTLVMSAGGESGGSTSFGLNGAGASVASTMVLAIGTNSVALCQDGGALQTDSTFTIPSFSRVVLGRDRTNSDVSGYLYGHIERFTYWDRRIADGLLRPLSLAA